MTFLTCLTKFINLQKKSIEPKIRNLNLTKNKMKKVCKRSQSQRFHFIINKLPHIAKNHTMYNFFKFIIKFLKSICSSAR